MYREMLFRCPRCRQPLEQLSISVGLAGGCSACGGVWLDDAAYGFVRTDFYKVLLRTEPPETPPHEDFPLGPLACPVCAAPLKRTILEVVEIDICPAHGTWFDAGELSQIAREIALAHGEALGPVSRPSPKTAELLESLDHSFKELNDSLVMKESLRQLRRRMLFRS